MRLIDKFLDRITMYRLLLYYLLALLLIAAALSQAGRLSYDPIVVLVSGAYLTAVCYVANKLFSMVWRVPVNQESTLITALILALIISPPTSGEGILFLTAAGGLAVASKYMLAINRQHVFNPAAIAVLLTSHGAGQSASWWVGSKPMMPFVVLGGLLLARKIRRVQMVGVFLVTAMLATIIYAAIGGKAVGVTVNHTLFGSALFFMAFVMLTEPLTSPTTLKKQRWYAGLTGLLFPPQVHFMKLYSTPELVLAIGNVFAYIVNPKGKLLPRLTALNWLAPNIGEFVFAIDKPIRYKPGQYMEWTLPHDADSRGERRYLTLASSPTEAEVRLGIKFYPKGSSYKRAMSAMDDKTAFAAGQLSGDFVLPDDPSQKLAFIAGGIGVTPFRSMLKYLTDKGDKRPVAMLYSAVAGEHVYQDILEAARERIGADIKYVVSSPDPGPPVANFRTGTIDADMIRREIPDYHERLFYLSGTHQMVVAMKRALRQLGVPGHQIKVDFFPGYA